VGKNGPRIEQVESKGIQTKMPFFKEKFILANIGREKYQYDNKNAKKCYHFIRSRGNNPIYWSNF
jgi:hypothetical protein